MTVNQSWMILAAAHVVSAVVWQRRRQRQQQQLLYLLFIVPLQIMQIRDCCCSLTCSVLPHLCSRHTAV